MLIIKRILQREKFRRKKEERIINGLVGVHLSHIKDFFFGQNLIDLFIFRRAKRKQKKRVGFIFSSCIQNLMIAIQWRFREHHQY